MSTFNNFDLHFIFERKNNSIQFLNSEYIHPLKQDLVQELQTDFIQDDNIKRAIVFGSAVEFCCDSFSDLDLCIQRYDDNRSFQHHMDEEIDVLYWDRIGDKLKGEIALKGIVVYEKEDS